MVHLDRQQRATLVWAGLAVVLSAFGGSVVIVGLPAIAVDFHANVAALANVGSALTLGALGALPLATLADRLGRRRLIAVGVAGFSLANVASAFSPSLPVFAGVRVVAVCFEALVGAVTTALIVEEAPADRRGEAVSLLAILGGAGLLVAIVVYPVIAPHWRWLMLAGGVGLLAAAPMWRNLPEGRTWIRVRAAGSAVKLLASRPWRRRVAIITGTAALVSLVLEPAGLLYTFYASSVLRMSPTAISILIFVAGVIALASFVAGGYVTDRFGRRAPGVVLTAGYTLSAGLEFVTGNLGFIAGNLLWSGLASAATPVMGAWSGELYPTRARATAESASAVAGAFGGVAGLQAVAFVSSLVGLGRSFALAGIVGVTGAALLLLLPETREQPLPE